MTAKKYPKINTKLENIQERIYFDGFCLLKPRLILRCMDLDLRSEESQSLMYSQFIFRTKKTQKQIEELEMHFKNLIDVLVKEIKHGN